jgi:glutaredoxin
MTQKELIMYSRTTGCPFVSIAKRVLDGENIPYREIHIDKDPIARQRVKDWTGFLSVPTLVIAEPGAILPLSQPTPLPPETSPQGIDRETMITEPYEPQLRAWLHKHGFVGAP